MKTPDRYINKFLEKAPQKAGTYTYTMSMWDPPGPKHPSIQTQPIP